MENVDIWFRYRNGRSLVLIIQSILRETEYAWSARAKRSYLWSKRTLFNLLKKQYQLCKKVYIQFLFVIHAYLNLFFFLQKSACMFMLYFQKEEKRPYKEIKIIKTKSPIIQVERTMNQINQDKTECWKFVCGTL